jgi:hypothetical protein
VVLHTTYDKAMDKVVHVGHILMKRPGVVVPKDIVADVLSTSRTVTKTPMPSEPKADSAPGDANA